MLFKAITLIILFFLLRNLFKSWKLFQQLQAQANQTQGYPKGPTQNKRSDDVVDAEFTVLDK